MNLGGGIYKCWGVEIIISDIGPCGRETVNFYVSAGPSGRETVNFYVSAGPPGRETVNFYVSADGPK